MIIIIEEDFIAVSALNEKRKPRKYLLNDVVDNDGDDNESVKIISCIII